MKLIFIMYKYKWGNEENKKSGYKCSDVQNYYELVVRSNFITFHSSSFGFTN